MTKSGAIKRRAGSLVPGAAFLAVALALAVLIALLPRTGNQPPPPTVAEFAPQAANEIKHALAPKSSNPGEGPGQCEAGQTCAGGPAKPTPRPTIIVPKVKECYGDPSRQTEDPQSPPCIPYWAGKTPPDSWKGIVGGTIRVAVPDVPFESAHEVDLLFDYFNKRFQFYGRQLAPVHFSAHTLDAQPVPGQQQADATDVDRKLHAFASLTYAGQFGAEQPYYDTLAQEHILSVAHRAGAKTSESYLARFAPYRWAVLPGIDTMQQNMAEMVCNVLAGKAPDYAGPGVTAKSRVFGLIYGRAVDGTKPDLAAFRSSTSNCGVKLAADVEYDESSDQTQSSSAATNTMLKMIQAGVTSVACFCEAADVRGPLMQAASGEQYRPEWIVSTYIDNDVDNSFSTAPTDQSDHVIGMSFRNKWIAREDMFWYRALKEADPTFTPAPGDAYSMAARYSSLLLLASGIQTAGPTLTPAAFQQGLAETVFANPGAGGPPYYEARVGFAGGVHTMIHDATMFWFSPTDRGHYDPSNVGRVCYVHEGRRFGLGHWPKEEPAFHGPDCGS